jgi:Lysylphosphatidylglycerol synthase TM region
LKNRHQLTMTNSLGVLIGTKILDCLFLLTIGCFSAAWLLHHNEGDIVLATIMGVVAFLGFLALPLSHRLLRAISRASKPGDWQRLAHFIDELILSYSALTNRQVIALEVTTALMWALFLTSFHLCALAVNGTPGLIDTYAAAVAGSFAFASPVNGLAQFGPFEAAWVSAAHFLSGVDIGRSLPAALLVHGATLIISGTLALMTILWLFRGTEHDSGKTPLRYKPKMASRTS